MKKKNRSIIVGVILVATILILLSSFRAFKLPFAITGSNTLSLSQVSLQSNNPYLNGQAWLLTFTEGGLGQHYTGTFSPTDVQSATSDSSTTTKSFTISVDYADQVWNYPIQQTSMNKPIYDVQIIKWTYIPLFDPCTISEAQSRGLSTVLYVVHPLGVFNSCTGIGYNVQSPVGNIQNPTLSSSYTITLSTPDQTASKTIDINSGSGQGSIGNYAYASWLGNLGSGMTFPSQSAYKTAYVNGFWRVISSSAYNNYISQINSVPPDSSQSAIDVWTSNLLSSINNAKVSYSFGAINSATSLNNAMIGITTTNPVQFPVTALYIKASEIGIYTPTPDFNFASSSSQCFQTGEQGTISATIINNGESGIGNVYAQCNSPFSTTQNFQLSLNQGQSQTIQIPLSASATQQTSGTCTVYVESPGGTKSTTVSTCVKPQITCTPSSTFCSTSGGQDVIKKCSLDGATSSISQICTLSQYCDASSGTPQCVEGNSGGSCGFLGIGCLWKSIFGSGGFFGNLFSGIGSFFIVIKLIVSILAGIISFVFSLDLFSRINFVREHRWLLWITSLIIGVLFFWLVTTYFYVGLIIFVIYMILKAVIGATPIGQTFKILKKVRK